MIHKIISPLYVDLPRKTMKAKRVHLNMNTYRNLHHISNSKAKKLYSQQMKSQLKGLKITTPVEITYKVYKPTKRIMDKMNVVSVVSKYLLDSITDYKCWEDDNDNFVKKETILPTEHDKDNPRVEIIIKEIKEF
jgi:Holliday junction resolvase RusA-like endonuclease